MMNVRRSIDIELTRNRRANFARSQRSAEREQQLRSTIDQRLAQHRHSDAAPLAIDVLCESFGLDTFHRTVLLLAVAPCFSQRFEHVHGQITGHDLHDALTVEVAFTFAELILLSASSDGSTFPSRPIDSAGPDRCRSHRTV